MICKYFHGFRQDALKPPHKLKQFLKSIPHSNIKAIHGHYHIKIHKIHLCIIRGYEVEFEVGCLTERSREACNKILEFYESKLFINNQWDICKKEPIKCN